MRIALVRKKFSVSGGGGAEKYASSVAAELIKRGHIVTVFAEDFKGRISKELRWVKVPSSMMPRPCPAMGFHEAFQATIKRSDFDVVYSLCRTYPSDVLRITEQLHSVWLPIYYSPLARYNPRHKGILKLERKACNPMNTGWIVTNSELVKGQLVREYAFPMERIQTIRNGVDRHSFFPANGAERHAFRERLKLHGDVFGMLFVAGNFKIKGLDSALRAFYGMDEELKAKSILLVVGGDKPGKFQRLAKRLGLEDKVHFLGERKIMRELYAACDVLLYPSLYEPFANVCLEAAACGLPSITTAMNGSSEIIEHGKSGYIVKDASDVKGMTACLDHFASLSVHDRSLVSQAILDSTMDYSWEKHVDALEELLEKAAMTHRHQG